MRRLATLLLIYGLAAVLAGPAAAQVEPGLPGDDADDPTAEYQDIQAEIRERRADGQPIPPELLERQSELRRRLFDRNQARMGDRRTSRTLDPELRREFQELARERAAYRADRVEVPPDLEARFNELARQMRAAAAPPRSSTSDRRRLEQELGDLRADIDDIRRGGQAVPDEMIDQEDEIRRRIESTLRSSSGNAAARARRELDRVRAEIDARAQRGEPIPESLRRREETWQRAADRAQRDPRSRSRRLTRQQVARELDRIDEQVDRAEAQGRTPDESLLRHGRELEEQLERGDFAPSPDDGAPRAPARPAAPQKSIRPADPIDAVVPPPPTPALRPGAPAAVASEGNNHAVIQKQLDSIQNLIRRAESSNKPVAKTLLNRRDNLQRRLGRGTPADVRPPTLVRPAVNKSANTKGRGGARPGVPSANPPAAPGATAPPVTRGKRGRAGRSGAAAARSRSTAATPPPGQLPKAPSRGRGQAQPPPGAATATPASPPTSVGRGRATQIRTELPAERPPSTSAPTPAPLRTTDPGPAAAPSAVPPTTVPAAPALPALATQPADEPAPDEPLVPRRNYADTDVLPLEEWEDYVTDMDVFYKFSDTQKKMAQRVLGDCESQVKTLVEQEHRNLGPGAPLSSRTQTYVDNVFGDLQRRLNNLLRRSQQAMDPAAHARSTWRAPIAGGSASRSTGSVRRSGASRTARTTPTTPPRRTNASNRSSTPPARSSGTSNRSGARARRFGGRNRAR